MPSSLRGRLQCEAAILDSLTARRLRTGDPALHLDVERRIIARELAELAEEWSRNPAPPGAATVRRPDHNPPGSRGRE
jgi:hypothetical protein